MLLWRTGDQVLVAACAPKHLHPQLQGGYLQDYVGLWRFPSSCAFQLEMRDLSLHVDSMYYLETLKINP